MVSHTAITVAALLQLLGISIFVAQPKVACSPAPALGAAIFLVAMLMLIWDCNLIPRVYRQRSPRVFTIAEVLVTVFVTELINQLGWCTYERTAYRVVSVVCYRRMWCELGLMTAVTVVGSVASLCIVVEVVCPSRLKDTLAEVLDSMPIPTGAGPLVNYIQDVRSYLMGAVYFSQLTRQQRLLAVQAFEAQVRHSLIPPHDEPEEELPEEELPEEQQENPELQTQVLETEGNQATEIPLDEASEDQSEGQAEWQSQGQSEGQSEEQSEEPSEEEQKNPEQVTQDIQDLQAVGNQTEIPQDEASEEQTEEQSQEHSEEQQQNPEQVTQDMPDLQDLQAVGNQAEPEPEPEPVEESKA